MAVCAIGDGVAVCAVDVAVCAVDVTVCAIGDDVYVQLEIMLEDEAQQPCTLKVSSVRLG